MKKYYQLVLVLACLASVIALLVYRHEYNHLRYVLEVLNFFGKPGQTSNDPNSCLYGINATFLAERLDGRRAFSLDVRPQFQRIDDEHYAYSSFWRRGSPEPSPLSQFYGRADTVVLGSRRAKQNFRCHFVVEDEDKPVAGKFSYSRLESRAVVSKEGGANRVLFIFHCKLARPLGVPYAVSFYGSTETNPFYSPIIKMVDVDKKDSSKSAADESNRNRVSFENNFKIAACVMPSALPTVTKRNVIEFLSFHKMLGISEFHVYDNSLSFNILERLQILPAELIGFTLHILPFDFPFTSENSHHIMRDLAELDCTFRSLNRNRRFEENDVRSSERISHIVNLSWDEYIVPRYHYLLKPFISKYETERKTKLQIPTLHFCLNQRNDPKVKAEYPTVIKKTHYDKSMTSERPAYIYNIESMSENDVAMSSAAFQLVENKDNLRKTEKLSQEIVAIHKYVDCKDPSKGFKNVDVDFADLETRPHQFEGAMIRFAEDFFSTQLYTLFRNEKIWSPLKEKPY